MTAALLLAACGNPEKSAQSAGDKALKAWQSEAGDLDPTRRLKRYDRIIKDVKGIGEDYPKTAYGRAIAAGRSVNGLSLTSMQKTRDELAPRAACYANPTVDCLLPFSSMRDGGASGTGSSKDSFVQAQRLVCSKDFTAADHALDKFKINKPAYSKELVQVALAAADCNKPVQVDTAIQAYLATLPTTGNDTRTRTLMSILATDKLRAAWPKVSKELESQLTAPGYPKNKAASVAVVLAVAYAKSGDTKTALEKYHYVTDTLGYQVDSTSKKEFSKQLILHGKADEGLKYIDQPGDLMHQAIALNDAAMSIGNRLKLTNPGYHAPVLTLNTISLENYMASVDASEKARDGAQAGAVEAALDNMAGHADRSAISGYGNSSNGIDDSYGIIALVHQKLGEPAKATSALKKGQDLRTRLLGANGHTDDYFAQFQTTLALAQGDTNAAIKSLKMLSSNTGGGYVRLVLKAMAQKGEGAKALSLLGDPAIHTMGNRNDSCYYCSDLVADLIASSQFDAAKQVIQAIPGGANQQARYYQQIDDRMAADGDQSGAEAFAKQHGLIKSPGDRLRLLYGLMDSRKIGGNRKRAEPILREMFTIGQKIDQNPSGYPGRWDRYTAQRVAGRAFSEGYTDLGIDLYQKADYKDQRPLFKAFTDNMKPKDMAPVLMLAQDNLQGQRLQIVIDAAIRHLQKLPGSAV